MPFFLQLKPIISDPEYLLDQHILISIKSSDSDESYGKGPGRGAIGTCSRGHPCQRGELSPSQKKPTCCPSRSCQRDSYQEVILLTHQAPGKDAQPLPSMEGQMESRVGFHARRLKSYLTDLDMTL